VGQVSHSDGLEVIHNFSALQHRKSITFRFSQGFFQQNIIDNQGNKNKLLFFKNIFDYFVFVNEDKEGGVNIHKINLYLTGSNVLRFDDHCKH